MNEEENQQGVLGGFSGQFTWQNIGEKIASGILSGAGGIVINQLFNFIFQSGVDVRALLQDFANQIVTQLSNEVKNIISQAFFRDNIDELKISILSLQEKYEAYSVTNDLVLLDGALNESFRVHQKAKFMELPALGLFGICLGLIVAVFKEKQKFIPNYSQRIVSILEGAERHVENMKHVLEADLNKRVGYYTYVGTPRGEHSNYTIVIDGNTQETAFDVREIRMSGLTLSVFFRQERDLIIKDMRNKIYQEIFDPLSRIIETLKNSITTMQLH